MAFLYFQYALTKRANFSTNIYLFKVKNRETRKTRRETCSKFQQKQLSNFIKTTSFTDVSLEIFKNFLHFFFRALLAKVYSGRYQRSVIEFLTNTINGL